LSRRLLALAAPLLALGLTACGADAVSTDELEDKVASMLEDETGNAPDVVDCPDELPAEEDESVRCTYEMLGYEMGATLTVAGVEDGRVDFRLQVDDEPLSGPDDASSDGADTGDADGTSSGGTTIAADQVAAEVSDSLEESVGRAPESVDCPSPLTAQAGGTTRCTLTDGGESYGVSVAVTEYDDATGDYHLDIQVDEQPLP
jgi:hypothetical protein